MSESSTELIDNRGPLGDGGAHAGKYNLRLIRRAVLNGWPVPDDLRESLVNQMRVVMEHGDERAKIGAARVILAAQGQNIKVDLAVAETRGDQPPPPMGAGNLHLHFHNLTTDELRRLASG